MATRSKTRKRRYQEEREEHKAEIRALRREYGYDGYDSHLDPPWGEPVADMQWEWSYGS